MPCILSARSSHVFDYAIILINGMQESYFIALYRKEYETDS